MTALLTTVVYSTSVSSKEAQATMKRTYGQRAAFGAGVTGFGLAGGILLANEAAKTRADNAAQELWRDGDARSDLEDFLGLTRATKSDYSALADAQSWRVDENYAPDLVKLGNNVDEATKLLNMYGGDSPSVAAVTDLLNDGNLVDASNLLNTLTDNVEGVEQMLDEDLHVQKLIDAAELLNEINPYYEAQRLIEQIENWIPADADEPVEAWVADDPTAYDIGSASCFIIAALGILYLVINLAMMMKGYCA